MNGDSCEVPREDLDDGFNPCRKQDAQGVEGFVKSSVTPSR